MKKVELNNLYLEEIKDYMKEIGEKPFRGEQIFNYIHKNKGVEIDEIKTLSKDLREKLKETSYISDIEVYKKFESKLDGTKKYLFALEDGNIIESVFMEYKHGISVCVSTQVGCRMGCSFCASTQEGLVRNLNASEMLNQIYEIERDLDVRVSNVVLMGSGEPLDNYSEVIKFINLLSHEKGKNISLRNITLSTCGLVPEIYRLGEENLPITLAISLHASNDSSRKEIMPIAKKYNLEELLKASRDYIEKTGRRMTFEYTLIDGVNDRKEDALELINMFKGMNVHINLIPLNPIEEYDEKDSSPENIRTFKEMLVKNGIQGTVRREMGRDISASCGQLRRSVLDL